MADVYLHGADPTKEHYARPATTDQATWATGIETGETDPVTGRVKFTTLVEGVDYRAHEQQGAEPAATDLDIGSLSADVASESDEAILAAIAAVAATQAVIVEKTSLIGTLRSLVRW